MKRFFFRFTLKYFGTGESGLSKPKGMDLKPWDQAKSIYGSRTIKLKALKKAIAEAEM